MQVKYELRDNNGELVHGGEREGLGHVFVFGDGKGRREFKAHSVSYPKGWKEEDGSSEVTITLLEVPIHG